MSDSEQRDAEDSLTENEQQEEEKGETEAKAASDDDNQTEGPDRGVSKSPEREGDGTTSIRPSTSVADKRNQQMLAELHRLRRQMRDTKQSIVRPTVEPYTPDIFNDLSPYYNLYMVDYTISELQQDPRPQTAGYGRRTTALGVVEPQVSLKMDSFPGPFQPSRVPGMLFKPKACSKTTVRNLPPLPMPSVPKFYQNQYQPHNMDYDKLTAFRSDVKHMFQRVAQRRKELDYDKTVQAWEQMSLNELRALPPRSRHHMTRTINSYLGTTPGSCRALKPLTKAFAGTPAESNE